MKKPSKKATKGAMNVLVAIVGGAAGSLVQNKIIPADSNEYLKAGAPAGAALVMALAMPKQSEMISAFNMGMAGATGSSLVSILQSKGILGAEEENQLLLDAFTAVNESDSERAERLLEESSVEAAADFSSSVAAAADFSSLIAGSEFAQESSW